MITTRRSILVLFVLFGLAIAAAILADVYKWNWAGDWVAPALSTLFIITLVTTTSMPGEAASERRSWARTSIRNAAIIVPVLCFLDIEVGGDTPVTMKFLGMSWSMSGYWATRLLGGGGLIIGAFTAWLASKETRPKGAKDSSADTQPAVI